jgi:hypothetical protein
MFETSESIDEIATALSLAQKEMGAALKDAKAHHGNYADLASVVAAIKEPLALMGLSYTQFPIVNDDSAGVMTVLMHRSGQWMRSYYTLPLVRRDVHSVGSAITYARRYALQAVAGIPADDDDGDRASQPLDAIAIHNQVCVNNLMSIAEVKKAIAQEQWEAAAEAYHEINNEDHEAMWIAPSKGGVWTTYERKMIHSDEFNAAAKVMWEERSNGR